MLLAMRRWLCRSASSGSLCDTGQIRDFLRGESANAIGGVRHRVVGAERAPNRQCKIVGRAFCLEIMEDREIELVIGDIDAASQRFTAQAYLPYWVIFMAGQFLNLMGNESLHSLAGRAQPDKACSEILRVQRASMKGCPQQRKACRQHPPCEFVERAAQ